MKKLIISFLGMLITGYSYSQMDPNSSNERTLAELKTKITSSDKLEVCYAQLIKLEETGVFVLSSTDWKKHLSEVESLRKQYLIASDSSKEIILKTIQFLEQHEISIDTFLLNYFK